MSAGTVGDVNGRPHRMLPHSCVTWVTSAGRIEVARRLRAGPGGADTFAAAGDTPAPGLERQVTDMAWDAEGNTYISDGYVNSRIAKVDKNGKWLKSWGEPGDQPGQLIEETFHALLGRFIAFDDELVSVRADLDSENRLDVLEVAVVCAVQRLETFLW